MDKIIVLLEDYIRKNKELIKYIENIESTAENLKYYRQNQEILYVGIVNRVYSLWETYCKDLAYEYYNIIKDYLRDDGLVQKLKLNELPGYIIEKGIIRDNIICYELSKSLVTYTSKNIGYDELKALFSRFDVDAAELNQKDTIKKYLEEKLEISHDTKNALKIAMKNLTEERNLVSHNSSIDQYQELKTIIVWSEFCMLLAQELAGIVCKLFIQHLDENSFKELGAFANYYKNKSVLCVKTFLDHVVSKDMIIFTKNGNKIINIYKAISFQIDDINVEKINNNDEVGIMLKSVFETKKGISNHDKIYIVAVDN